VTSASPVGRAHEPSLSGGDPDVRAAATAVRDGATHVVATAFVGTAIVGSLIAGHFGTKLDTHRLRWFAYHVFAVAAYVLVDNIFLR
jgi:hypothetical protein